MKGGLVVAECRRTRCCQNLVKGDAHHGIAVLHYK